jgi:hypothetical protein
MQIVQLVAAIIGILLGATQVAREVAPLVPAKTQPQYVYRGEDSDYRYWSDSTGRYWCRMNREGALQYAEVAPQQMAPQQIASNPTTIR